MYTDFFGLNEKPFAITPDPRYLFMSERHGEGLAHLVYGVTESGGFIQLTGEVGTGKTTLVRTLLSQMPSEVNVALVLNPQLTSVEFLVAICDELGVSVPADRSSTKTIVDALNKHLLDTHARGRRTILLVDEAQNLSEDVLEQVRLLTNLETAKQKLLQIILIGQEELRDLLAQNNLRQLAQRVTGRYHLEPMSRDETMQYIDHRLRVAGAITEIFEPAAKREVFRLAEGIPRLINVICDRALLGAYSTESRVVTKSIVRRAAREVADGRMARHFFSLPVAAVATAVLLVGGAWLYWQPSTPEVARDDTPRSTEAITPAVAAPPPTGMTLAASSEAVIPALPVTPSLSQHLRGTPSSMESAMRAMFDLWQIDYQADGGPGCQQAAAAGLSCMFQRGTWSVLRQLNHPAILTLVDAEGANHYPVVARIDGKLAELQIGDQRVRLPLEEIDQLWFGQYLMLWEPPNGRLMTLQPGARGENVLWLRNALAELDPDFVTESASPDTFDASLEQALREFQRRNRLQVDGVAGQQTQILINSLLADQNTPLLGAMSR